MNVEKIRNYIYDNLNKKFIFRLNGSRNQVEEFEGVLYKAYKSIFLIEDIDKIIKSFSYSDLLIGNIEIIDIVDVKKV